MSQKELERQLTRIYRQARDDIGRKWYEYFEEGERRLAAQEKELEFLKAHGTKEEVEQAERELEAAKQNFTLKNEYYRDMVKETTRQMADVNQTAAAYVNGQLPSFYAETYNGEMAIESVEMGIKFDMADEATVKRRVMDGDIQLPEKKVNVPKDMRWNTKAINSNVLQGIVQGESMDKIAKRLEPIMDGNRKAAIRNARTLVNGAENQGRQDKYNELGKRGVVLQKQWIATGDERTRDWHLDMDGQRVDTDEKFVDGNGNELEYPGDPSAPPETVYNCRCTMKGVVVGFRKDDGEMIRVEGDADISELHNKEIRNEIERREREESENRKDDNRSGDITGIETRGEAYEAFSGMFGSVEKNLDKIDEELLVENANQLIELNKRFGVLDDNNYGSITASPSGRAIAYAGTGNRRDNEIYNLGLSSSFYSDKEMLISKEKRMIDNFYSMPCSSEKVSTYSITHEYGHLLEAKIIRGRTDYDVLDEKISNMYMPSMSQIRKVTDDEEKAQAKQIWKEIVDIAKEENENFSVKANLSEYGRTNHYEAFAETFANSQCGEPNELGNAMNKWLEREGY